MVVNQQVLDAARHIAASPQGRVLLAYLNEVKGKDIQALVYNDNPEQARRLQGQVRALDQVLKLFEK